MYSALCKYITFISQTPPQITAATMGMGLTTRAQSAPLSPVTAASLGVPSTHTATIFIRSSLSCGEATTSVVTQVATCRPPGVSPWTLRFGWTCVTSNPAVSASHCNYNNNNYYYDCCCCCCC